MGVMAIGIIGIIIALAIFLYGAYKNVSVLYLAPLCGVIVAVTNGMNPTESFTSLYIGAVEQNASTGVWEIGGLCGMIPSLTVERVKSGYKPSKYGQCSHFLSCIDMCYFSVLFTTFVFLMIVRMEVLVMIS